MITVQNKILENMTFIDLFAGIGGFRLGLESLGAKCVFSSEIDKSARETYISNFNDEPAGDITKIDAEKVDIIQLIGIEIGEKIKEVQKANVK